MGRSKKTRKCPRCDSKDMLLQDSLDDGVDLYVCADCDYELEVSVSRFDQHNVNVDDEDEFDEEPAGDRW